MFGDPSSTRPDTPVIPCPLCPGRILCLSHESSKDERVFRCGACGTEVTEAADHKPLAA